MNVAYDIQDIQGAVGPSCVTIGNFDGVHKGHQKLFERVRKMSTVLEASSVVVTFDPHPLRVLAKKSPPFITLLEQKLELIADLGMELCLCLPFTREMASMEPRDFVRSYLVQGLGMRHLVIGYDYAFGRGRSGNYELLQALGREMDFSVEQVGPVLVDDAVVSSSRVRDMVQAGKVWEVRPLLGRFYQVRGQVVRGRNRGGRLLGFPTANLLLRDELFPKPGVYAVWAQGVFGTRPAVANIGYNPTFDNHVLSVEVHVMDLDRDLYGTDLRVHFVHRLRSERRFSSLDELKGQIAKDAALGRQVLSEDEAAIG
jgi:riboflavin kinase/FMN adenylyltransferase